MKTRIAIVEDDETIRRSMERYINRSVDFCCSACYASAEEGLEAIPLNTPDMVLMDINLPGMNGVECVRRLKPLCPKLQIVMLTIYDNLEQVFEALRAGAVGYLLKQNRPEDILSALREVGQGGAPMSSQIARMVVQAFHAEPPKDDFSSLSERERTVLDCLCQGLQNKEIADKLAVGYDTVRTYVRRIYEKLHVHSRAQAVALCRPPSSPLPSTLRPQK
jgi:DNA-binding NarL/FixJ family response regulator